jgi:hypothetical protein
MVSDRQQISGGYLKLALSPARANGFLISSGDLVDI